MPAVPLVMGAATIMGGGGFAALATATMAGGLTGLAAGATLLGGVAQIAGGLKGGNEGMKWAATGGLLSLGGAIGGGLEAGQAAKAANAGSKAAEATMSVDPSAVSSTDKLYAATNSTPATPVIQQSGTGLINRGTGAAMSAPVTSQVEAAKILAEAQNKSNLLQMGGSMLQGHAAEQRQKDVQDYLTRMDREKFTRTQYTGMKPQYRPV